MIDATRACKARYYGQCPKTPDLQQGNILRVYKVIQEEPLKTLDCFMSVKSFDKNAHIIFVASVKNYGGILMEHRMINAICIGAEALGFDEVH